MVDGVGWWCLQRDFQICQRSPCCNSSGFYSVTSTTVSASVIPKPAPSSTSTRLPRLASVRAIASHGLLNGPMFRKFSFRQVSFFGASVVFIGLIFTTFSNNFISYLMSFSIIYGAGVGITASANALALNTYFKKKRRIAAGMSWTTTGLGPIFWPIVITTLLELYGELGVVLIMTALSLHAIACSLLLQPVQWHAKKEYADNTEEERPLNKLEDIDEKENGYFSKTSKFRNVSAFSSQYIYNEDDPINTGYEIIDPGTPMLSKCNDGYFSASKRSLNRLTSNENSVRNSQNNLSFSKKPSFSNLNENRSRKSSIIYLNDSKKNSSPNLIQESYKGKRKISTSLQIPESEIEDCPTLKAPQDLKEEDKAVIENFDQNKVKIIEEKAKKHYEDGKLLKPLKLDEENRDRKYNRDNSINRSLKTPDVFGDERKYIRDNHSNQSLRTANRRKSNNFNYENEVLKQASLKLEQYVLEKPENGGGFSKVNSFCDDKIQEGEEDVFEIEEKEKDLKLTFFQKVSLFFDLDLLQDFTYVNLMIGITISNFNELNFSILTPFILGDFGMTKPQVAMFMSLLAGIDISVRFCIPFVAGKIGWDNSTFFLVGVMAMAMGRVVLAHCQLFNVTLLVAVMIGFGKGLRTVFMALVIPSYVPLHKLPGATGLQLVTSGIVFLAVGPVVGWIKDNTNNTVTLHCLNIFTYVTAISWGFQKYRSRKQQQLMEKK